MKTVLLIIAVTSLTLSSCTAERSATVDSREATKDSVHATMIADSLRMEKLFATAQYPLVKGGKGSGVIPVTDPTEVPDPKQDYKLLFELTSKNPDSLAKDINGGLDEVARVLNLHVASGVPAKKLIPVIVIHGAGIEAVMNNESYKKKHLIDNPNLKIIKDLEDAGAKIIVCGQAMAFGNITKDQLLPEIKISLTAQTVLSNYQLQGFVLYAR